MKLNLKLYYIQDRSGVIYLRMSVDGVRTTVSTGINVEKWNNKSWTTSQKINARLRDILSDVEGIAWDYHREHGKLTAAKLKSLYTKGYDDDILNVSLYEGMKLAYEERKKRNFLGESSEINYMRGIHIIKNLPEIRFTDINTAYVDNVKSRLSEYGYNTRVAYFFAIKSLVTELFTMNVAKPKINLFENQRISRKQDEIISKQDKYLSADEFLRLRDAKLSGNMEFVRDIFMFQCYTGLGFSELIKFDPQEHIIRDIESVEKIRIQRQKTQRTSAKICDIPVFPEVKSLMKQFPLTAWSKPFQYNQELRKLSSHIGISRLHSHRGRHTFGTIMLERGFSIESVSYMMGHSDSKLTSSVYAKITASKINVELRRMGGV